jgi:hypothetical protein
LRLAEVQQPKTAQTLSLVMRRRDSSANVGQSDLPSARIASTFRPPRRPPESLICWIAISTASTTGFSLIAMVPVIECSTPTLMGGIDSTCQR